MTEDKQKQSWWPFKSWGRGAMVESTLVTAVPLDVAIQKLRGFVSDHDAKITHTDENDLSMEVSDQISGVNRRKGDRAVTFTIDLKFSQRHVERANSQGLAAGRYVETRVLATIRPRRDRDRRLDTTVTKARRLLGSLKSYLMANEDEGRWPEPNPEPAGVATDD